MLVNTLSPLLLLSPSFYSMDPCSLKENGCIICVSLVFEFASQAEVADLAVEVVLVEVHHLEVESFRNGKVWKVHHYVLHLHVAMDNFFVKQVVKRVGNLNYYATSMAFW